MRFGRTSAGSKAWSDKVRRPAPQPRGRRARGAHRLLGQGQARRPRKLPFAEDLLAAYYCAFDRETPLQVRAVLLGALAYFVMPFDGVPDLLPLLGFTDDAAVLATAMKLVIDNIRPEHREAARTASSRAI